MRTFRRLGGIAVVVACLWSGVAPAGAADLGGDHWSSIPVGPLSPRTNQTTLWTGTDLIIWGGVGTAGGAPNNGAVFDPKTNTWAAMPPWPLPPNQNPAAVWTGHLAIFWGGQELSTSLAKPPGTNEGASYNPATRRWKLLPPAPPSLVSPATAQWTGHVVIFLNSQTEPCGATVSVCTSGATYNPVTEKWGDVPLLDWPASGTDVGTATVWTGSRLVTWSTFETITKYPNMAEFKEKQLGAEWTPGQATWRMLPTPPQAFFTYGTTSFWLDDEQILTGGSGCLPGESCPPPLEQSAEIYRAGTGTWSKSPPNLVFDGNNLAVSTGSAVVVINAEAVISGRDENLAPGDDIAYDPTTNTIRTLPPEPASLGDSTISLVWTGHEILLWGADSSSTGTLAMKLSP